MNNLIVAILDIDPVGSRVTCTPPPKSTDRDHLVLVSPDAWDYFVAKLFALGWTVGGSSIPDEVNNLPPDQRFASFTLGEDNIIATRSPEFYRRFMAATSVSKHLNLLEKDARIALFQAVLYGNPVRA